jgi:hypothetical protein
MVLRWCNRPGHGSYPRELGRCPACPPKRGRDTRARAAQRQFRTALLAASDGRCCYVDANGIRCDVTTGLQAAHVGEAYSATGGFEAGAMLCPRHHRMLDRTPR